jgi:hypothetical protein
MAETYGEMIQELVDSICKYDDRVDVFRRNDIPKGHFYNVINPNRQTSGGRAFYTPIEWMIQLTNDSSDYSMARKVAKDMKGVFLSREDLKRLSEMKPEEIIQEILSIRTK